MKVINYDYFDDLQEWEIEEFVDEYNTLINKTKKNELIINALLEKIEREEYETSEKIANEIAKEKNIEYQKKYEEQRGKYLYLARELEITRDIIKRANQIVEIYGDDDIVKKIYNYMMTGIIKGGEKK